MLSKTVYATQGHSMESFELIKMPNRVYLVQLYGNGSRSISKLVVSDK